MAEKARSRTEERFAEQAEEFRARVRGVFPSEFRQHMLASRKEFLLAIRSLIDSRIENLDRAEERATKKATRIPVE